MELQESLGELDPPETSDQPDSQEQSDPGVRKGHKDPLEKEAGSQVRLEFKPNPEFQFPTDLLGRQVSLDRLDPRHPLDLPDRRESPDTRDSQEQPGSQVRWE